MTETQDKYLELLAVNRELVEERESSQQESYEVTEYLRKEILAKKEKILALEAQLDEQERKSAPAASAQPPGPLEGACWLNRPLSRLW